MESKNVLLMKAMPWLLIVFGFISLNAVSPMIGFACMLVGIVMLIERRWPEKWGNEIKAPEAKQNINNE